MRSLLIRGKISETESCPIAHYLNNEFRNCHFRVAVDFIDQLFDDDNESDETYATPKVIENFILKFDSGEYPGLEE